MGETIARSKPASALSSGLCRRWGGRKGPHAAAPAFGHVLRLGGQAVKFGAYALDSRGQASRRIQLDLFLGQVDGRLRRRQHVRQFGARLGAPAAQAAGEHPDGASQLRVAGGVDHVGHRLSGRQINAAGEECPRGELARLRPSAPARARWSTRALAATSEPGRCSSITSCRVKLRGARKTYARQGSEISKPPAPRKLATPSTLRKPPNSARDVPSA